MCEPFLNVVKPIKIYVPPLSNNKPYTQVHCGALRQIIKGIEDHPCMSLSGDENQADYIIVELMRHPLYVVKFPAKTIIIDYRDSPFSYYSKSSFLICFKRSLVNREKMQIIQYPKCEPIQYCLKSEYLDHNIYKNIERTTDVSYLFNSRKCKYRNMVYHKLQNSPLLKSFNIKLGDVSSSGNIGRSVFSLTYHNAMMQSKIVVTCNPSNWEGDWRLQEALVSKALVFQDKMISNYTNFFKDGEHLIFYDRSNLDDLVSKIVYYLDPSNTQERIRISENGFKQVLTYHNHISRIDQIVDETLKLN